MSVAAPTAAETRSASGPVSLWTTGLVGGVYVLATLAVVFYAVPNLWQMGVTPWLLPATNKLVNGAFSFVAVLAALVGLVIFGMTLAGPNPPKGIRGSIFLGVSTIATAFFLLRAVLMIAERMSRRFEAGQVFSLAFVGVLAFLFFKFLASDRMPRWSVALETAGWFNVEQYKKNQGLRVRRLTILGLIVLLGSGIYTMLHNNLLPAGDWAIAMPYSQTSLTLLPDARLTVPLLLTALVIWFSWRVVNFPVFADFLIATEAEINKVSWTPRARLIQDTIVVLITVFVITLFLFLIDVFWGWLLSREIVRVLPTDSETQGSKNTRVVNKNEY